MKPREQDPRQSTLAAFRVQNSRCQSADTKNAADLRVRISTITDRNKMLSYRRETALQGAL